MTSATTVLVRCAGIALVALYGLPFSAGGELAVRLTDLRPGSASGVPGLDAAVFADKLYFAATADGGFLDLWSYDGVTPPGKVSGSDELQPTHLTTWQGALYFLGGPTGDRELWKYDGVQPPVEVLDLLNPGSGSPDLLTAFGAELCFRAITSAAVGDELVCWDGSTAPDVYDLRAGALSSLPEALTALGDGLYFGANVDGLGREPWRHETFLAPELVGDLRPGDSSSSPDSFVQNGALLYLRAADSGGQDRLWVDDGVVPPAMVSTSFDVQGGLASWGGKLLVDGFEEADEEVPDQLHVLRAGGLAPAPWPWGRIFAARSFLPHRNALYFSATQTLSNETDLFRYCGGGIVERVTDQFAEATASIHGVLVLFQDRIYFSADDPVNGRELWYVDPMTAVFCDGVEDGHDDDWSSSVP